MRLTIAISDEMFRKAEIQAQEAGIQVADLLARFINLGLSLTQNPTQAGGVSRRKRGDLPVARPATGTTIPYLNNARIHEILEAEL